MATATAKGSVLKVAGFRFQARSNISSKKAREVASVMYEIERSVGLTADNVLENARDKRSVLHDLFDWDDSTAAEKWRRSQASDLIRSVHVIYESDTGQKTDSRAFVSVEQEERQYIRVENVMTDPDLRQQVLQRALAEAKQWRKRYDDLAELGRIFQSIEVVEQTIKKRTK